MSDHDSTASNVIPEKSLPANLKFITTFIPEFRIYSIQNKNLE
jgi:hypothetical protein